MFFCAVVVVMVLLLLVFVHFHDFFKKHFILDANILDSISQKWFYLRCDTNVHRYGNVANQLQIQTNQKKEEKK